MLGSLLISSNFPKTVLILTDWSCSSSFKSSLDSLSLIKPFKFELKEFIQEEFKNINEIISMPLSISFATGVKIRKGYNGSYSDEDGKITVAPITA